MKPKLQNDQNLPKWNRRSCMGQFLEFSDEHYYLAEMFHNLSTGYISPQFHLVSGDLFETVICNKDDENVFNGICNYMFDLNRDWYAKDENDDNGKLI